MHEAAAAVGSSTLSSFPPLVSQDTPLAGNTSTCISWQRQDEEVRHKTSVGEVVGRYDDELDERWLQDELNVGKYDDIFEEAIFASHAPIAHKNTVLQEQGTIQSQPPEGSAVKDAEEQEARARYNAARARCALPPFRPADSSAAKSVQDGSFETFGAEREFERAGFP